MLRSLLQIRSRNCPPDVQQCLAAFNRSEYERLLPVFRRWGPRMFFIAIALLVFVAWGVAACWEIHR